LEPIVCVYETGSNKKEVQQGDMLCQIFNFIDTVGGKQNLTVESKSHPRTSNTHVSDLERVLKTRGVLKCGSDKETQELNSALLGAQAHVQLPGTN